MTQKSLQKAKDDVEMDFYKILNNSNFSCSCRNNVNNYMFESIFYEVDKLCYVKK